MSAPDILANMRRGWNRDPSGLALGTERTRVAAALWTCNCHTAQEVYAEPDDLRHIVSLQLKSTKAELEVDGSIKATNQYVPAGTIQGVRAGERPRAVKYDGFAILHIYIPPMLVAGLCGTTANSVELSDSLYASDLSIERTGREVLAEMRNVQPLSRLRIDALGQDLAIQLPWRWSNPAGTRALPAETVQGVLAPWQQRRATEYLADNIADDVRLATLAGVGGLSTFHFGLQFKRSTGQPPHAYLRRVRCEKAKALLTGTDLPITEIAVQVGYETSRSFARMFRAEVGANPNQYRRERRS
ncbi:MAG TPA: AraC family transcriptional regulator [Microvirga sp.]|nr:AraC family transcriptional regulator [Microvirga sp.]